MSTQQRRYTARRPAAAALRPARIALILEVEYRRAQRDLHARG
ncbi:MAG TPA: hypothetical protein VNS55_12060 [Nocardioides sp.]|nr:hypothetical protein [Nocardioides sp.]